MVCWYFASEGHLVSVIDDATTFAPENPCVSGRNPRECRKRHPANEKYIMCVFVKELPTEPRRSGRGIIRQLGHARGKPCKMQTPLTLGYQSTFSRPPLPNKGRLPPFGGRGPYFGFRPLQARFIFEKSRFFKTGEVFLAKFFSSLRSQKVLTPRLFYPAPLWETGGL